MTWQVIAGATPMADPGVVSGEREVRQMCGRRWFYGAAAVVGTVVPWLFFGSFLDAEGLDLVGFVEALFANGAAGGFSADLLITAVVFWVWAGRDSLEHGVERWWIVVPATVLVGLSLAFPLYLLLREGVGPEVRPGYAGGGALRGSDRSQEARPNS